MASNPIIYIAGKGYSYQHFDPFLGHIQQHFESILQLIKIRTPDGNETKINLYLEASNENQIYAHAKRLSKEAALYEIRFSAGLSYHVWLSSRYILADYNFFNWLDRCKFNNKELRKRGRKGFLADFGYFISSYYIILHELAHIVLGHCDYIKDVMKIEALEEYTTQKSSLPDDVIKLRKAFEAEADRQAGTWLAGFFNLSLGPNSNGVDFMFPSKDEAYQFYIYSITSLFILLQQLCQRSCFIHPLPSQRQNIVVMSLLSCFEMLPFTDRTVLVTKLLNDMISASKSLGLVGAQSQSEIAQNAIDMIFVDSVTIDTNIRKFQHIVTSNLGS